MHIKIILFVMLLALSLGSHCSTPNEQQYTQTEILWDSWGVPHIYAATEADLYYAFGWAQMHNHGNLIASLYGQARGEVPNTGAKPTFRPINWCTPSISRQWQQRLWKAFLKRKWNWSGLSCRD
jgi:hypothetical protein